MSKISSRREPEVIVFQEPVYSRPKRTRETEKEKEKFLRGDVKEIFISSSFDNKNGSEQSDVQNSNDLDLKETLREVQSLAASSLTGRDKRRFEEEQIKALGAKAPKSDYVPYPHYQRVMSAKREKEKRLEEELRLTQMFSKKKRRTTSIKGKGRWKDSTKSLEPAIGKFKGGVLKLNKKDLTRVTSKPRTKK